MSYKRLIASCLDCKKEISTNNLCKHIDSAKCKQPFVRSKEYSDRKERSNCIKCGKLCKSFASLTQHEIRCNNERQEQINKKCERCHTEFVGKTYRARFCSGKCRRSPLTVDHKRKISDAMKKAVNDNPKSFSGGYNRGRIKTQTCSNGFVVLGKWEQTFVEFCLENNIEIQQPNTGFAYEWNGSRTYFPDFYLPESDQWIEIKGYETDRDKAKWESLINLHKKTLLVIKRKEIDDLKEWYAGLDSNQRSIIYEIIALGH